MDNLKGEFTSAEVASIASDVLSGRRDPTEKEIKALAASCLTQASDRNDVEPGPPTFVDDVRSVVDGAERVILNAIEALESQPRTVDGQYHRMIAIGRTQIQLGFMALERAMRIA